MRAGLRPRLLLLLEREGGEEAEEEEAAMSADEREPELLLEEELALRLSAGDDARRRVSTIMLMRTADEIIDLDELLTLEQLARDLVLVRLETRDERVRAQQWRQRGRGAGARARVASLAALRAGPAVACVVTVA